MSRHCALVFISTLVLYTGCLSNQNRINPYMGYGSPRIPAPATGSYQIREPYYQQQSQTEIQRQNQIGAVGVSNNVKAESNNASTGGWRPPRRAIDSGLVSQPESVNSKSSVQRAVFQNVEAKGTMRGTPTPTDSSLLNRIQQGRMHANEIASPPEVFLPEQPVRGLVESSGRASSQPDKSASSQTGTSPGWRPKYTPKSVDGVVVR
ncbi:MAG: hypothetical protein IH991_06520 [Planctomycetes bacterium]|nr:hypothetical protein [Planctomycetota bacterium]